MRGLLGIVSANLAAARDELRARDRAAVRAAARAADPTRGGGCDDIIAADFSAWLGDLAAKRSAKRAAARARH